MVFDSIEKQYPVAIYQLYRHITLSDNKKILLQDIQIQNHIMWCL